MHIETYRITPLPVLNRRALNHAASLRCRYCIDSLKFASGVCRTDVPVIPHQAIGMHTQPVTLMNLPQEAKATVTIAVIPKDRSTL